MDILQAPTRALNFTKST